MMYYTIYKTTNKIDGKFYIGSHKTKNLNDEYMGSGKYLKHAIWKYGIENFKKEILFVFDNPDQMYAKEAEIVNEEFITTYNTYNLKIGGFGGFDYLNGQTYNNPTHSSDHSRKMTARRLELYSQDVRCEWSSKGGVVARNNKIGIHDPDKRGNFSGRTHSSETKKIMAEKAKLNSAGTRNSQYGTMWITDGTQNKKIQKNTSIPEGWYAGRKWSIGREA